MPVAIVTGAASGIGRATAMKLSSMGYAVALAGRTAETLEEVAREIGIGGGKAMVVVADCSKRPQVEGMIERVVKAWERIDALVNCVGVAPSCSIVAVSDDEWHEVLETNLSSVFYATRAVWPVMSGQKAGVIVNISSMAAKDPFPGLGAYAVAKSGVNMLTLVTAREGASVGIRVHCVAPGAVETPMLRKFLAGAPIDEGFVLAPADIAAVVADAVQGSLHHCSGDTIYVHRSPA